jgi:hypothetical protein
LVWYGLRELFRAKVNNLIFLETGFSQNNPLQNAMLAFFAEGCFFLKNVVKYWQRKIESKEGSQWSFAKKNDVLNGGYRSIICGIRACRSRICSSIFFKAPLGVSIWYPQRMRR